MCCMGHSELFLYPGHLLTSAAKWTKLVRYQGIHVATVKNILKQSSKNSQKTLCVVRDAQN